MQARRPFPKLIFAILTFVAIIVGISILATSGLFHKNPYGPSIKIDNFKRYFKDISTDDYDNATAVIYIMASQSFSNTDITIPTSGAFIRDDSITTSSNQNPPSTITSFLVDIPAIERTYKIQFNQSENPEETMTYPVVVLCPTAAELIYPSFPCSDATDSGADSATYKKYPFLDKMPIIISRYADNGAYVSYRVNYEIDENTEEIKITITDNTGGNYENALASLREIGADPKTLSIEYINASQSTTNLVPGRPKGNSY